MHATTRAALVAGPALFLAGGCVASLLTHVAGRANAFATAVPVELLPRADRLAAFAVLVVTIALAACAARIVVDRADEVPRSALALASSAMIAAAACWPVVFSADLHAYAAYGIVLLHGGNPYAGALHAPLADAALAAPLTAWSGSIPRDVYGPLFTAIAAVAAATTHPVAVLRIVAIAAYGACVLAWRPGDARGAAAFATHPVVAWAAIEGHNDMLALLPVLLAFGRLRRGRAAALIVAASIKAFALAALAYVVVRARVPLGGTVVASIVLAAWIATPHGYAWYAVWLVAAGRHAPPSAAHIGLRVAAYTGLVAYLPEVFFGAHGATFAEAPAFMGSLLMMHSAVPLAAALAATALLRPFAASAQSAPPTPPPLSAPTASAAPLPATQPIPTPAPSPAVTASPTPTPAPTPNPYTYVIAPPAPAAGLPAITEIAMTDRVVHSGGTFAARISTGADVSSVYLEAYGQRLATTPAGPGRFTLASQVPNAPSYLLNRSYTVYVNAVTADGRQSAVAVTVRLER